MKVVVDTNVIVSALMNVNGTPAKITALILNGKIKPQYDNRIIFEYFEVLSRKEFGFNPEIIHDMIDFFKHEGEYVNADPLNTAFLDESDKKFYEVHKTGQVQYLISGNKKHYPIDNAIVTPKEFLELYDKDTATHPSL
ncbi:MAG: putative toxin-antitoxin system toxin component, PIN family [Treponema sp.]|nr:putative toxin-antitoxin system toxin component, PIN family [Treponema sp.]